MFKRFRRLRLNENLRALVKENTLNLDDLIYPLFVVEGKNIKKEINSMPGVFQMSIDEILKECQELISLGIKAIILFGVIEDDKKDSCGSDALNDDGLIARSLREIKAKFPNLILITDLCFCEYTDHGHCGIINPKTKSVDNDLTLEISAKQALIHAKNGADMIAPSGMMDGIVQILRKTLDENGFENLPIMAYSTKFASAYYGPFREVAKSTPSYGDRKSYQMDFANGKEALNESLEDEKQGADILMVKPALAYLDVVKDLSNHSKLPICVYNVSGEYALLKAGQKSGVIDYEKVVYETMLAFKRAGAKLIITYHAKEIAKFLTQKGNN
ncbi:porphobilinogen synthase [Campylobacter insulaenigrae]|uniref:Delta-aminolevulinic acid dehydratase n=1 Tax=Campylobacter insulaenigrae TaxID=260714 RepID=A0ABY3G5Z1_9BACT|nr:porphobilinogen synthase [Campylobacter insulaenigrae]MCR6573093.1 porphobilinogen synthase [Campylobacter insulaenigrae]MCR6573530.1 porphobilinogen synthase [Campylobacter insulaenigrae]MCR6579295.1 porphobilinogen synthase [Campylobacter insulaenigrae]MCR6580205.1 porphobilinogen synthase [Campylobacter insulaenigrae]MCR6581621.1 porphobilinogen synthase [Campylobacter insulaenigrae]